MDESVFKELLHDQLISEEEFEKIRLQKYAPLSVFGDVTTMLYAGVVLLAGALGILVYKYIDSIGHAAILSFIGFGCIACFFYCFRHSKKFSYKKIEPPTVLFDYVLLLGCLLMLTFIGYLQFTYNVFGNDWGMATFIPMVLLFSGAYYFDHLGVLSLAITNLAAWAGFTVAPLSVLTSNDFTNDTLIITGVILGVALIVFAFVSEERKVKAHFSFTYKNFGTHLLYISMLAALFHFDHIYFVWFLCVLVVSVVAFQQALKERSFYFLVVVILYSYVAVSYVFIDVFGRIGWSTGLAYIMFTYFILSGIALIRFFIHYNKLLRENAHLQR